MYREEINTEFSNDKEGIHSLGKYSHEVNRKLSLSAMLESSYDHYRYSRFALGMRDILSIACLLFRKTRKT